MSISMPILNHIAIFILFSYLFSPHRHSLFSTTGIARGFLFDNKSSLSSYSGNYVCASIVEKYSESLRLHTSKISFFSSSEKETHMGWLIVTSWLFLS